MEKIKVCFIGIYAYPLFAPACEVQYGGAEVDLVIFAEELAKDPRYEVIFVVGDTGQPAVEYLRGIKVVKVCSPTSVQKNYFRALKREYRIFKFLSAIDADVYFQEAAGTITATVASVSLFRRKKFIYRLAHDMDCNRQFIRNSGIMGKLYWFGLTQASCVIAQNKRQQEMLLAHHHRQSTVMRNSHKISDFQEYTKDYILWVARCENWKRPKLGLEIAKAYPRYKFLMISPKQTHQLELFQETAAEAATLPNVRFIEKVPFAEIQDVYNHAKIFIGTSDYEGFPNTYIQACMGGTPIVSLRVNPDNFLHEYDCGYCAEGDLQKMQQYIGTLLTDELEWRKKSQNAFAYAKAHHDIEKNILVLKQVITALMG